MRHRAGDEAERADGEPVTSGAAGAGVPLQREDLDNADGLDDVIAPRSTRVRVGIGAGVVILIAAMAVAIVISALGSGGASTEIAASGASASASPFAPSGAETSPEPAGGLLVHVLGAVKKPGLVSLGAGARVVDAVAAAGGLTDDAEPAGINLARAITDGEQLVVPRVGEVIAPPAAAAGGAPPGGAPPGGEGAVVNLNTATQEQLESLQGIGPALATRILDWRAANGRFASVADLMKVSGIGQKIFDGFKDRITV
ncbi:ComEA family DNA-binding protein [Leifsonia sp. NPDC058292]|uniref:ComEA family DNA-binding protein n=1 Tax=Leifsonia sp. NPDC058292 TaxID=3346428 RepID=UPI0036D7624D